MASTVKYPDYKCTLSDEWKEKAQRELHEDPSNRQGAIDALRKWAEEQPHINAPLDSDYLLGFLRTGKFSQLAARKRLENMMKAYMELPEWFRNIDMKDPKIDAFLDDGVMTVLPGRTDDGCAVFFGNIGLMDCSSARYDQTAVFKALIGIYFYLMWQDDVQVNGFLKLGDFGTFGMKHRTFLGLNNFKKMANHWQATFPVRFKGFNYYAIGPVFETILAIIKPLLNTKLRNRLNTHSTLETVYETVPMRMLPAEYLPDDYTGPSAGPHKDIIAKQKAILQAPEFRQLLLERTSDKYGLDLSKMPTEEVVQESFRKLNVD